MKKNKEGDSDDRNYPEYIQRTFEFLIPAGQNPIRLDQFLTDSIANATRSKVQTAIEAGVVTVNGKTAKASQKIKPGDFVQCHLMKPPPLELVPENIPLDVWHEDEYLLVVNKPAGMVTHPGFGNRYGTLVNALLYHMGERNAISLSDEVEGDESQDEEAELYSIYGSEAVRPGIVHRLDKDTSGLLVIAKSPEVHARLAEQFSSHTVERIYHAVVWGRVKEDTQTLTTQMGRSPRDRKVMAVLERGGKTAITTMRVLARFEFLTLLELKLQTGRTHQIRVHCSHLHHPLLGDQSYGGNTIAASNLNSRQKSLALWCLTNMPYQALHARILGFVHPVTRERLRFEAPYPEPLKSVVDHLFNESERYG